MQQNIHDLRRHVAQLLAKIGHSQDLVLTPVPGGLNNRGYKIKSGKHVFFLKSYFSDPADPRDRLSTEFSFMSLAWKYGIRAIPRPYIFDRARNLGVYEFVEGTSFTPGSVSRDDIANAAEFVVDLNRHRKHPESQSLADASEACFSLQQHIDCVDARIGRLEHLNPLEEIDSLAVDFASNKLRPAWKQAAKLIVDSSNTPASTMLSTNSRCLSPSDFGFHNALQRDGNIVFLDFEYAGWDDPAKLVCDFFCQPAIPVSMDHFESFTGKLGMAMDQDDAFFQRCSSLLSLYVLKWCCIMLNEFLSSDGRRRSFAAGDVTSSSIKRTQLDKAVLFFNRNP